MGVGDGDGERIGGVWPGDGDAGEQMADHGVDLLLFGGAGADYRLFDQPRRVFANRDARSRQAKQRDAARLHQLQRRLRVLVDVDFLNRRCLGPMLGEQRGKRRVERQQALGQRCLAVGAQLTVGQVRQPVALGADQAPAGGAKAGVKAEDDQPSFSITASETS